MSGNLQRYETIKQWRDQEIFEYQRNVESLNSFHDQIMRKVFDESVEALRTSYGAPPCKFSWFVTGSGGRKEQGMVSDQDHGIVYEYEDDKSISYFQALGEEISRGLFAVGYPYCTGEVMSSNPLWCKPLNKWSSQIKQWLTDGSWESIRFLQIFYDARTIVGECKFVKQLKFNVYTHHLQHDHLLIRFMENIMFMKPAIGPLGQLLLEPKGQHEGSIDFKYSAFLPYVNATRLLAIKEGLTETSTISRLEKLSSMNQYGRRLLMYRDEFKLLQVFRLALFQTKHSYEEGHYIRLKDRSRMEKREIKRIIKNGKGLHQYVQRIIEKGC